MAKRPSLIFAAQPARFAGTLSGLALQAVPLARHLRASALRILCVNTDPNPNNLNKR